MSQKQQFEGEIDLIDYIKMIYKRRWIVVAVVILGMLYGVISEMRRPDIYEASATFFPLDSNFDMRIEGLVVKAKAAMKDLVITLLSSKKMADKITEQLDLKKIWNTSSTSLTRSYLQKATQITIEPNNLIRLVVRTASPELSAKIANAYVDNLDYFNQQLDIGVQRNVVQVIDTATVPDDKMPHHPIKKALKPGFIAFGAAAFLIIIADFMKKVKFGKK